MNIFTFAPGLINRKSHYKILFCKKKSNELESGLSILKPTYLIVHMRRVYEKVYSVYFCAFIVFGGNYMEFLLTAERLGKMKIFTSYH